MRKTFAKRSLPLLHVLVCLLLTVTAWPQARPKPSASPIPHTTAPGTTPGPCSADYYKNSDGVCVHRPVKSQNSGVPQGATAQCRMVAIHSASTEADVFASWRGRKVICPLIHNKTKAIS